MDRSAVPDVDHPGKGAVRGVLSVTDWHQDGRKTTYLTWAGCDIVAKSCRAGGVQVLFQSVSLVSTLAQMESHKVRQLWSNTWYQIIEAKSWKRSDGGLQVRGSCDL